MLRCPVCGSTTIYPVTGGLFGQVYRCKECGYRGSFVLETDDEEKEAGPGNEPRNKKTPVNASGTGEPDEEK